MTPNQEPVPRRAPAVGLRISGFNYSAVELLAALAVLFFTVPFVNDLPSGDLIEALLVTLVMVSAVLAVGGRRRTLVTAVALVIPALAAKWMNHLRPDLVSPLIYIITAIAFFAFISAQLLLFILRARQVDANVLCAGLSGYLLLGLLWVPAYLLVARLNPAAFVMTAGTDTGAPMDGFHAFYFSFITLCTVGYGDVTPVSKVARMLAVVEAIAGLFYMAVLISRLVSVYSSNQPADGSDSQESGREPK